MTIRDARPEDLPVVRELVRAAMWEAFDDAGLERPSPLPRPLRHELDHLTERYEAVLVATRGALPVGCVALRPQGDADTVVMNRLYVAPDHRRTRLGRQLAAAAIDRGRELGYRKVVIDVIPQRTSVIRLYKALGFRDIEPFIDYPFPMVFLGVDVLPTLRPGHERLPTMPKPEICQVTVVLFEDFELLDVFGPLEVLGVTGLFGITLLGPKAGQVRSAQGPAVVTDLAYQDAQPPDIVLVPGGMGTRRLVADRSFTTWLGGWASTARVLASVCTGSGLLASAGLLDGYRATSNKRAFSWAREQGPDVVWVPEARWVQDGNRWTSSGVAAGIDMTLGLLAELNGNEVATAVADGIEYEWHRDSSWDPFAAKNGLGTR